MNLLPSFVLNISGKAHEIIFSNKFTPKKLELKTRSTIANILKSENMADLLILRECIKHCRDSLYLLSIRQIPAAVDAFLARQNL